MKNLYVFFSTLVLSSLLLVGYEAFSYHQAVKSSLDEIDSQLNLSILTTDLILGENFHDRVFNEDFLTQDEIVRDAIKLTEYAELAGIDYIYTMVRKDEAIYFIASSLDGKKYRQGVIEDFYWISYDDAPQTLLNVFESKGSGFEEYTNQWGHFRSFFVYKTSPNNFEYVVAADINVSELAALKSKALTSALANLLFLFFIFGFCFYVLSRIYKAVYLADRRKDLALSAGSIGIWEWDIENESLFVSPSIFQGLGFDESVLPKNIDDVVNILHPDDVPLFSCKISASMNQAVSDTVDDEFEVRAFKPSGEVVWLFLKGKTLKWNKSGNPALRVGVIENITEIKSAHSETRESLEKVREREKFITLLINSMPDLISYKDSDGVYQLCNLPFEDVFDCPLDTILGETDQKFFPVHIVDILRTNDLKALDDNDGKIFKEWILYKRSDVSRLIETKKIRVQPNDSSSPGILSIGRDVTEVHTLLSELDKFKRFSNYSAQGFLITSLNGEVQYLNAKAHSLFNLVSDDLERIVLTQLEVYPPSFVDLFSTKIVKSVTDGIEWTGEVSLHQSGNVIPTIHTIFVIRNERNIPIHLGLIVTDISKQKVIEERLLMETVRAESANKSKSMFLANMSHEIRTPLNAVIGFSQILSEDSSLADGSKHYVDKIYKAGQRLLNLINDILDLSKIEAGKLNVRCSQFNLLQELEDVCSLFSETATGKGLKYSRVLDLDADLVVSADKQKLNQVLMNLISNAVKYTDKGDVTVEVSRVDGEFHFVVSDSGRGMSREELDVLFTPFQQGALGELSGGGTGLGLALARNLSCIMGGVLSVESAKGEGTQCTLVLPLESSVLPGSENSRESSVVLSLRSPIKAVVVDDDDDSLNVLSVMLENIGFEIVSFSDSVEAKDYILSEASQLVFTDIRMPRLDGEALLEAVRKTPQCFETTFIAVSASSLNHQQQHFIDKGFKCFISKPVEHSELTKALLDLGDLPLEQVDASVVEDEASVTGFTEVDIDSQTVDSLVSVGSALDVGDYDQAERALETVSSEFKRTSAYASIQKRLANYAGDEALKVISQLNNPIEN